MKRFGFHPDQLYFNMRNPQKVRYLETKELGKFEAPMKTRVQSLSKLHKNHTDRLEFEKYMNPNGLKPTITSRFAKPAPEIEFVNHEMLLMRSPKPYDDHTVCFRHNDYLSKPEIKQYMQRLYNMPVQSVGTFRKQGKFMTNNDRRQFRKQDWKKSIIRVDYEVDSEFQKII